MTKKKTYEPFDELLKETGMKYAAIAEKAGMKDYTLYRLRQQPSKLDSATIAKISKATGINEEKIFKLSYFFATKVDKIQQKAS